MTSRSLPAGALPPPTDRLAAAEARLLARRESPPDPLGAAREALAAALGPEPCPPEARAAALALAAEVGRFGAAFAPGTEPAYHDRHHQAEAALAMGWLCGAAREAGMIDAAEAAAGVLAMIGHDLHHDGRVDLPTGTLEARSAEAACRIAAAAGVAPAALARIRDVILATNRAAPASEDPLARLAREADLFASLTPALGWQLGALLARELAAGGVAAAEAVAGPAGRLAFLRAAIPEPTPAAAAFGLDLACDQQVAAYAEAGRRLGLAAEGPEAGAEALEALPRDAALDHYREALAAIRGAP